MTPHMQWIAFATHVRKEASRIVRIWPQTIIPPLIQTGLYFLVFGHLMKQSLGPDDGISFPAFMIPGLAMTGLINGAYSNVCFSVYGQRFQRSIEELIASPMSPHLFIWGFLLGGLFRGLIISLLTLGFGLWMKDPQSVHSWAAFFTLSLFSAIPLGLAGFLNGLYARSFDQTSLIPTFVLMPMTFLGGTFYSIDSLAPNMRWLVEYNPFYAMISSCRFAVLGIPMASYTSLLLQLGGLSALLYLITWVCVKRGYGLRN